MRYLTAICVCCITLLAAGCDRQQAHDVALHDTEGNVIQLAEFDKQWLIINYWATWCKPCYTEIPELNAFYASHEDDIALLGVSFDRTAPEGLPDLAEYMGITFPTLTHDPAPLLGIDHIPALPATYIFDQSGALVTVLLGEQTQASLEHAIGR